MSRNYDNENPFHIVSKYGFNELFQLLINAVKKKGGDPQDYLWLRTLEGETPLSLARANNHEKIAKQLLELI